MAKRLEHYKALKLRTAGKSINEISKYLSVSKSTASLWCRDIRLSIRQQKALASKSKSKGVEALLRASEKKRLDRITDTIKNTVAGKSDVGNISKQGLFFVGLGLYWGEGYKSGNDELGFTNSDPHMIKFYMKWLERIYGVQSKDLILRVSINSLHKDRVSDVEKYWSNITNIPLVQFSKCSLIKTAQKKIYKNHEDHFGTLRVKVRRGTSLRRRILGSIDALASFK